MSIIQCSVVRDLMISYLDGETSTGTNQEVEQHLRECSECAGLYQHLKTVPKMLSGIKKSETQKEDTAIVIRAFNRLRITLSTIIVLWILFGLSSGMLGWAFGVNKKAEEGQRALRSLVGMTRPGVIINGVGTTNRGSYAYVWVEGNRQVGNFRIPVFKDEARVSLLGNLTLTRGGYLHQNNLPFPLKPVTETLPDYKLQEKLKRIEKLPAGLEAEGVVSFKSYLNPEAVDSLLRKYDGLTLTWAAFRVKEERYSLGFPIVEFAARGNETVNTGELVYQASRNFAEELQWLGTHEEKITGVAPYPRMSELAGYIKTHGMKIYGGVVIGSTDALKKLQHDENVMLIEPGEIGFITP